MPRVELPAEPPISVRHRDGWCATWKKTTRYADNIKTVCNHYVTLPWGIERKWPTCAECRKRLGMDQPTTTGGEDERS